MSFRITSVEGRNSEGEDWKPIPFTQVGDLAVLGDEAAAVRYVRLAQEMSFPGIVGAQARLELRL